MIPLLLGYLDSEDRISLEKLIGRGGGWLYLSLECLTKGGLKWTPF